MAYELFLRHLYIQHNFFSMAYFAMFLPNKRILSSYILKHRYEATANSLCCSINFYENSEPHVIENH